MSKFRVVQRQGLFYAQKRICFVWFYEDDLNFAHNGFDSVIDENGMIGFVDIDEAKRYLDKLINSQTRVVYEIET